MSIDKYRSGLEWITMNRQIVCPPQPTNSDNEAIVSAFRHSQSVSFFQHHPLYLRDEICMYEMCVARLTYVLTFMHMLQCQYILHVHTYQLPYINKSEVSIVCDSFPLHTKK